MAYFFDQWTKHCDQHFFFINCSGFFEYNGFMPYLFTYRAGWRFGSGSKSSGLGVKKLLICFDCATLVSSATISYNKKRQQPNLFNLNQKIIIKKYNKQKLALKDYKSFQSVILALPNLKNESLHDALPIFFIVTRKKRRAK